mgnify:CR=1 FL=1
MKKILVAYFSASGTTAYTAKEIAKTVGQIYMRSVRSKPIQMQIWTGQIKRAAAQQR